MSFQELLETIRSHKSTQDQKEQVETKGWVNSKEKRLKELKKRELKLLEEASKKICPTLSSINQAFYNGKGRIILTPLSAEKVSLGNVPRFRMDYAPYLDGQDDVRVEVKIELFPPKTKDSVCTFNVWEPSKGWHDLKIWLAGTEEYKFFNFGKEHELQEVQAYIATKVKESPYF